MLQKVVSQLKRVSRGTVEYTSLPTPEGVLPEPQVLQIPQLYNKEKMGSVCTMEWSSDGYVLAVGWEHGWAVWSVGGRCLAWGFGVEYEVDEERLFGQIYLSLHLLRYSLGSRMRLCMAYEIL